MGSKIRLAHEAHAAGWKPHLLLRVVLETLLLAALGLAPCQAWAASAQDTRTVWDAVYTADQAARGREAYDTSCSQCHQPTLTGAGESPALVGSAFMDRWREDTLGSLFTRISTLMPFDAPATLPHDDYLDIVAYILQANAFPAGPSELTPDDLARIQIVGKEGPGRVPNFALVQVIGCLTEGPGNTWLLTNSTEPIRTASPKPSSEAELKVAESKPLGGETFRLLSVYPNPGSHKGHKVEAKGFLVKMADENRINVSSLQMVATSCGQ
jgi:mono/diheme cytochrome c family protein